jgi:hypothetical protein
LQVNSANQLGAVVDHGDSFGGAFWRHKSEVQTIRQFPGSQVFAAKLSNELAQYICFRPEGNGQENRSGVYAQAERQDL